MAVYSTSYVDSVDWFMFSLDTKDLISSKTVPDSVSFRKDVNRPSVQVPGGSSDVSKFGSIRSGRVSFALKFANFNESLGIIPKIKELQNLINPIPPFYGIFGTCLLYTSPSPRDRQKSRMPSSA